jgi:hypothetical protein
MTEDDILAELLADEDEEDAELSRTLGVLLPVTQYPAATSLASSVVGNAASRIGPSSAPSTATASVPVTPAARHAAMMVAEFEASQAAEKVVAGHARAGRGGTGADRDRYGDDLDLDEFTASPSGSEAGSRADSPARSRASSRVSGVSNASNASRTTEQLIARHASRGPKTPGHGGPDYSTLDALADLEADVELALADRRDRRDRDAKAKLDNTLAASALARSSASAFGGPAASRLAQSALGGLGSPIIDIPSPIGLDESHAVAAASHALRAARNAGVPLHVPSALLMSTASDGDGDDQHRQQHSDAVLDGSMAVSSLSESHMRDAHNETFGVHSSSGGNVLSPIAASPPQLSGDRGRGAQDDVDLDLEAIIQQYAGPSSSAASKQAAAAPAPTVSHGDSRSHTPAPTAVAASSALPSRRSGTPTSAVSAADDSAVVVVNTSATALKKASTRQFDLLRAGNRKMISPLAARRRFTGKLPSHAAAVRHARSRVLERSAASAAAAGAISPWVRLKAIEMERRRSSMGSLSEFDDGASVVSSRRSSVVALQQGAGADEVDLIDDRFGDGAPSNAVIDTGYLNNGRGLASPYRSVALALLPPSLRGDDGAELLGEDGSNGLGGLSANDLHLQFSRSVMGLLRVESLAIVSEALKRSVKNIATSAGLPTAIVVHPKWIAIGTSKSVVLVFDHAQELKCIVARVTGSNGQPQAGTDGAVTAMDAVPGQDVLLVGYQSGKVALFDLSNPSTKSGAPLLKVAEQHRHAITCVRFISHTAPSVISVDVMGVVNFLSFSKVLGLRWSVDGKCVLDGTKTGPIVAVAVLLPPQAEDKDRQGNSSSTSSSSSAALLMNAFSTGASTSSGGSSSGSSGSNAGSSPYGSLVALCTREHTYLLVTSPEVAVIHKWARPEGVPTHVTPTLAWGRARVYGSAPLEAIEERKMAQMMLSEVSAVGAAAAVDNALAKLGNGTPNTPADEAEGPPSRRSSFASTADGGDKPSGPTGGRPHGNDRPPRNTPAPSAAAATASLQRNAAAARARIGSTLPHHGVVTAVPLPVLARGWGNSLQLLQVQPTGGYPVEMTNLAYEAQQLMQQQHTQQMSGTGGSSGTASGGLMNVLSAAFSTHDGPTPAPAGPGSGAPMHPQGAVPGHGGVPPPPSANAVSNAFRPVEFILSDDLVSEDPVSSVAWLSDTTLAYVTVTDRLAVLDTSTLEETDVVDVANVRIVAPTFGPAQGGPGSRAQAAAAQEALDTTASTVASQQVAGPTSEGSNLSSQMQARMRANLHSSITVSDGHVYLLGADTVVSVRSQRWSERLQTMVAEGEWVSALALALDTHDKITLQHLTNIAAAERQAKFNAVKAAALARIAAQSGINVGPTGAATGPSSGNERGSNAASGNSGSGGASTGASGGARGPGASGGGGGGGSRDPEAAAAAAYAAHYDASKFERLRSAAGPAGKGTPVGDELERLIRQYVVEMMASPPADLDRHDSGSSMHSKHGKPARHGKHHHHDAHRSAADTHFILVAAVCIDFCVTIRRVDLLFGDIFDAFAEVNREAAFLEQLEPYILHERLGVLPPLVLKAWVDHHRNVGLLASVERCLLHLDLQALDINNAVRTCLQHRLWSALVYVINRGLLDYSLPIDVLMTAVMDTATFATTAASTRRPSEDGGDNAGSSVEILPLTASEKSHLGYTLMLYIAYCITGRTFPHGRVIPWRPDRRALQLTSGTSASAASVSASSSEGMSPRRPGAATSQPQQPAIQPLALADLVPLPPMLPTAELQQAVLSVLLAPPPVHSARSSGGGRGAMRLIRDAPAGPNAAPRAAQSSALVPGGQAGGKGGSSAVALRKKGGAAANAMGKRSGASLAWDALFGTTNDDSPSPTVTPTANTATPKEGKGGQQGAQQLRSPASKRYGQAGPSQGAAPGADGRGPRAPGAGRAGAGRPQQHEPVQHGPLPPGSTPATLRTETLSWLFMRQPERFPAVTASMLSAGALLTGGKNCERLPGPYPRLQVFMKHDPITLVQVMGRLFTDAADALMHAVLLSEGLQGLQQRRRCLPGVFPPLAAPPTASAVAPASSPSAHPGTIANLQSVALSLIDAVHGLLIATGNSSPFAPGAVQPLTVSLSRSGPSFSEAAATPVNNLMALFMLFYAYQAARMGPGVPAIMALDCAGNGAVGASTDPNEMTQQQQAVQTSLLHAVLGWLSSAPPSPSATPVPAPKPGSGGIFTLLLDGTLPLTDNAIHSLVVNWDSHTDEQLFGVSPSERLASNKGANAGGFDVPSFTSGNNANGVTDPFGIEALGIFGPLTNVADAGAETALVANGGGANGNGRRSRSSSIVDAVNEATASSNTAANKDGAAKKDSASAARLAAARVPWTRERLLLRLLRTHEVPTSLRAALLEKCLAADMHHVVALLSALSGDACGVVDAYCRSGDGAWGTRVFLFLKAYKALLSSSIAAAAASANGGNDTPQTPTVDPSSRQAQAQLPLITGEGDDDIGPATAALAGCLMSPDVEAESGYEASLASLVKAALMLRDRDRYGLGNSSSNGHEGALQQEILMTLPLAKDVASSELKLLRSHVMRSLPRLASLEETAAADLILDLFGDSTADAEALVATLDRYPPLQFAYLQQLLRKAGVAAADVGEPGASPLASGPEVPTVDIYGVPIASSASGSSAAGKVSPDLLLRYISLLCRLHPDRVLPFLSGTQGYPLDRTLVLVRDTHKLPGPTAFLLERTGDIKGALKLHLFTLTTKMDALQNSLVAHCTLTHGRTSPMLTLEAHATSPTAAAAATDLGGYLTRAHAHCSSQVDKYAEALQSCIALCSRHCANNNLLGLSGVNAGGSGGRGGAGATDGFSESEALWFAVLDALVDRQRVVKSTLLTAAPAPTTAQAKDASSVAGMQGGREEAGTAMLMTLADSLRQMLEAMKTSVALNKVLSKILSDHSKADFSEFREVLVDVVRTYHYEQRIIATANHLLARDIYAQVHKLHAGYAAAVAPSRSRGVCSACSTRLLPNPNAPAGTSANVETKDGDDGNGDDGDGGTKRVSKLIMVFGCGHGFHESCVDVAAIACPLCAQREGRENDDAAMTGGRDADRDMENTGGASRKIDVFGRASVFGRRVQNRYRYGQRSSMDGGEDNEDGDEGGEDEEEEDGDVDDVLGELDKLKSGKHNGQRGANGKKGATGAKMNDDADAGEGDVYADRLLTVRERRKRGRPLADLFADLTTGPGQLQVHKVALNTAPPSRTATTHTVHRKPLQLSVNMRRQHQFTRAEADFPPF